MGDFPGVSDWNVMAAPVGVVRAVDAKGYRGPAAALLLPPVRGEEREWTLRRSRLWMSFTDKQVLLYDLRYTYAGHVVMSGENLPLVGCLLGHWQHRTTAGYTIWPMSTSSKQPRKRKRLLRRRCRTT